MPLSYTQIKKKVIKKFGLEAFDDFTAFVQDNEPNFWGEDRPRWFEKRCIVMALYKDLNGISFDTVLKDVTIGMKISKKSFVHNTKEVRRLGNLWGESTINLGDIHDWEAAARSLSLKGVVTGTHFWMDSSDFKKERYRGMSRKSTDWSFKLNRPGRRFMFLRDGKGRIRKLWGGYSPKLYDGDFLDLHRRPLESELNGAKIIADTHFAVGKKMFENVTFVTPWPEPGTRKRKRDGEGLEKLSKEKRRDNKIIRAARSRVEDSFGIIKTTFRALNKPWAEEVEQLDNLVLLAVGCYNFQRQR